MYREKIYFTKDQLERFLQEQSEKDRIKFNNMYVDKEHIDILKIVDECTFKITDEVFDIYWENKKAKEEDEERKNGIARSKGEFRTPSIHDFIYTEGEIKEIKGILNMSEEELDNYISDMKSTKTKHPKLNQRKVLF